MGFLDRPQSVPWRRTLFQIHLWLGVAVGAYVFVVCVTGALLVFRIDLQRAWHPHLFTPSASGPLADPVAILESAGTAFPGERVAGIDAPTTARPTYLAYTSSDARFRTLLLDPVTAELLGELPERSLVRGIQDLHFDLLAGRTGRVVNGVGAFCLLLLCVTGAIVWWPGRARWRRAILVDPGKPWRRIVWELHGAVGVWSIAFVAMWAVTGAYFAFPAAFRRAVDAVSPLAVARPPESGPAAQRPPLSWRHLMDTARAQAPGAHVARVVVPSTERGAFLVMFSNVRPTPVGTTELASVYLDQYNGKVLVSAAPRRSSGDVVMAWLAPLHVGGFGGPAARILWFVLGLAPPALYVTGFVMWWTRVVRPGRPRQVAQPKAEAGVR